MDTTNVRRYDPLDPIECLETCLKKVVLKNYRCRHEHLRFADFFLRNAKVLQIIAFGAFGDEHRLPQKKDRASQDAKFRCTIDSANFYSKLNSHDLSKMDPFSYSS